MSPLPGVSLDAARDQLSAADRDCGEREYEFAGVGAFAAEGDSEFWPGC